MGVPVMGVQMAQQANNPATYQQSQQPGMMGDGQGMMPYQQNMMAPMRPQMPMQSNLPPIGKMVPMQMMPMQGQNPLGGQMPMGG